MGRRDHPKKLSLSSRRLGGCCPQWRCRHLPMTQQVHLPHGDECPGPQWALRAGGWGGAVGIEALTVTVASCRGPSIS